MLGGIVPVPALVPRPRHIEAAGEGAAFGADSRLLAGPGTVRVAELLAGELRAASGWAWPLRDLSTADGPSGVRLVLSRGDAGDLGDEGYQLHTDAAGVSVTAASEAGLFYGTRTLLGLLPPDAWRSAPVGATRWTVPGVRISDGPRFGWRGLHLDVARHFFPLPWLLRLVDLAALHKFNVLHLHLTDDQGWRIAINSWPRLAEVGGDSSVGDDQTGFYTQQQYEQIVAYAAAHYVTIVPEIDMPAHTNAAISAYGQLACDGQASQPYYGEEVGFIALCTSSQQTYAFVKDVLTEMAQLTPGPYLHIGGDEAHTLNAAQYSNFFDQTQPIVRALGKKAIGWDAITQSTMQPSTVIEWWDNTQTYAPDVVAATQHGSKIIMAPSTNAYLDQKYTPQTQLGLSWAGYIEVADAYNWDPTTVLSGVPASSVLGVEAPLWTETLRTTSDLEYMAFPRLPAIAEIGWSPQASHSWSSFQNRLAAQGPIWVALGMNFYRSPQIPWPAAAR
jgi:hexosaminidase